MSKRRNTQNEKLLPDMGSYVTDKLKKLKLTNTEAAKHTGWSKSTITFLLKKRIWNAYEMYKIGKFIGENLFELFINKPTELVVPAKELEEVLNAKLRVEDELRKTKEELLAITSKYEAALEVIAQLKK